MNFIKQQKYYFYDMSHPISKKYIIINCTFSLTEAVAAQLHKGVPVNATAVGFIPIRGKYI